MTLKSGSEVRVSSALEQGFARLGEMLENTAEARQSGAGGVERII
jgi:hypothetical protein